MKKKEEVKEEVKKTENEAPASAEERRLLELRTAINNDDKLDEYFSIYMTMLLTHASRLKINFEEIKKLIKE